jgi:MSHA biogenesis protein MshJ
MKYLKPLFTQFKALNTRERFLTVAAFLGVVYFLFDTALIRPQATQAKEARQKIAQHELELVAVTQALQSQIAAAQTDPLARQRAQRDEMRATFAEAEALLGRATVDVRMGDVVRTMVATRPGLTLVSLKTIPSESFFQPPAAAAAAPASAASASAAPTAPAAPPMPALYKHGVEVTVQGSYPALLAYMQQLERNTSGMFWGNVRLDATGYPEATLRMSVYTLSARPEQPLG